LSPEGVKKEMERVGRRGRNGFGKKLEKTFDSWMKMDIVCVRFQGNAREERCLRVERAESGESEFLVATPDVL
jgi:hypothetical protein